MKGSVNSRWRGEPSALSPDPCPWSQVQCASARILSTKVLRARREPINGTREFIGKAPGSLIMGIPSGIPALLANVNDGVGVPDIRVGVFSRSRIAPPMRLISEAAAPPQCRCSGCAAHARHPAKLPYYFACLYLVAWRLDHVPPLTKKHRSKYEVRLDLKFFLRTRKRPGIARSREFALDS